MKYFIVLFGMLLSSCAIRQPQVLNSAHNESPKESVRLLMLDGDQGSVACRIHGTLLSGTVPKTSEAGRLECATRSLLRMKNLIAVRKDPGASMVGPCDYYGNLENPHEYFYTIKISDGLPYFIKTPDKGQKYPSKLAPIPQQAMRTIAANWISGKSEAISEKLAAYGIKATSLGEGSLFPQPGILEIKAEEVLFPVFDARGVDLSSFKARLVKNDQPFKLVNSKLKPSDEFRVVSFMYEPGYASKQINDGVGLFLETHDFVQSLTPLNECCGGFVSLARAGAKPGTLDIIAVQVPFGWTIIIEKHCIHGDTTFSGFYMMTMTTDHITMQSADSVFIKSPLTKKNVRFSLEGSNPAGHAACNPLKGPSVNQPLVIYNSQLDQDLPFFKHETKGYNFVFNPFSQGYYQRARLR